MQEEQLQQLSRIFLADTSGYATIRQACTDYKNLLLQISQIDLSGVPERENIRLAQGEALGTVWAAQCIDDFMRTKKFIKGTYEAVRQVLKKNPEEPTHLLYAGTGPFAALILPLTCVFGPEQLQFTLIEINPISYQSLKQIIVAFQLEKYIRHVIQGDAMQYQIPAEEHIDILLSETMQAGLRKEAQVPIFYHFLAQTPARQALIIPQRIRLYIGFWKSPNIEDIEPNLDNEKNSTKLGCYFELSQRKIQEDLKSTDHYLTNLTFPPTLLTIPEAQGQDFGNLVLFTEIEIFQNEKLTINESGLTIPLQIRHLKQQPAADQQIKITYSVENTPGEIIKYIN